jgi:sulfite exporter TauE/SafE
MSSKTLGRIVTTVGFIILTVFALADLIGLGQSPDEIGFRQLAGVVVGALVIALGFYISRRQPDSEGESE